MRKARDTAVVMRALVLGALFMQFVDCQMPAPKAPEPTTVTFKVPRFSPVKEGTETQEKGGVVLQMAPPLFKAERQAERSCQKEPPTIITVGPKDGRDSYEVREIPKMVVSPSTLHFTVKVTNKMDQVLKLEGTIFKLNVDGKEIALSADGTKAFVGGILTPNEAKEFTIQGPEWSALPENATINFSIYSIPVAIDKAGAVTERGNYDWTFKFTTDTQSSEEQVAITTERMTPAEAAAVCRL